MVEGSFYLIVLGINIVCIFLTLNFDNGLIKIYLRLSVFVRLIYFVYVIHDVIVFLFIVNFQVIEIKFIYNKNGIFNNNVFLLSIIINE